MGTLAAHHRGGRVLAPARPRRRSGPVDGGAHGVVLALYVAAYLAGGTFAARAAIGDLFRGHVNVDLLMVVAAIGAAFVDAWGEGAILLGLFSTSNALEHHALGRTRRAVRALMELSPEVATVLRPEVPGGEVTVPVEALTLADVVLVRPGERVAVDGLVIAGETTIDQSAITGESMPVGKRPGDAVFAGTINGYGAIQVRVTEARTGRTRWPGSSPFVEAGARAEEPDAALYRRFEGKYAVGVIACSALLAIGLPAPLRLVLGRRLLPSDDAPGRRLTLRPGHLDAGLDPLGAGQCRSPRHPLQGEQPPRKRRHGRDRRLRQDRNPNRRTTGHDRCRHPRHRLGRDRAPAPAPPLPNASRSTRLAEAIVEAATERGLPAAGGDRFPRDPGYGHRGARRRRGGPDRHRRALRRAWMTHCRPRQRSRRPPARPPARRRSSSATSTAIHGVLAVADTAPAASARA